MNQGRNNIYLPNESNGFGQRIQRQDPPPDYGNFKEKQDNGSRESLDSTGKQKSFFRLVERFAEKTSMQGVPYINGAKKWYAKLLWTILLIGCSVGMGLHLYYLINQFSQWPVMTKITLGFDNLYFPAVTVCNVNPIRQSKLDLASQELQSLLAQLEWSNLNSTEGGVKKRRKRFVDELSKVNTSQFNDYEDEYSDEYDYDDYEFGGEVDIRTDILDTFYDLYTDESRDNKIEMGHHLDQMLLSCTMGRYKCYASNFTLLQHDIYGNCYTFKSDRLKIAQAGPANGLTLVLYMDKEEYLTQITEGYGARIQIHDRDTYPNPKEEGIYVPSSSETQIGLRKVIIKRQDSPYGTCTNINDYKSRYGFKYTRSLCQTLCVQESVFKTCGCYEDDASELHWQINNRNLKYCATRDEVKCMLKELNRQQKHKASCSCHNPCTENQFMKTLSHRNWPTEDYMFTIKDGVCDQLPDQCQDADALYKETEFYKRGLNYVKINIYYEDLNFEQVEETPEIENAQFASDVGGAIGLWIGLSFLSMFEVVQLCLECCAFGVHKCTNRERKQNRRKRRRNKQSRNNENPYVIDMSNKKSPISENNDNYPPRKQNSRRYQDLYEGNAGQYMYDYIDNKV